MQTQKRNLPWRPDAILLSHPLDRASKFIYRKGRERVSACWMTPGPYKNFLDGIIRPIQHRWLVFPDTQHNAKACPR